MSGETYQRWEPLDSIPENLVLISLTTAKDDLVLILENEENFSRRLRLQFSDPAAFRSVDEQYRLRLWHEAEGEFDYPLYLVQNSMFLEWFEQESHGGGEDMIHYAVFSEDSCIDILSSGPVKAAWVENT